MFQEHSNKPMHGRDQKGGVKGSILVFGCPDLRSNFAGWPSFLTAPSELGMEWVCHTVMQPHNNTVIMSLRIFCGILNRLIKVVDQSLKEG